MQQGLIQDFLRHHFTTAQPTAEDARSLASGHNQSKAMTTIDPTSSEDEEDATLSFKKTAGKRHKNAGNDRVVSIPIIDLTSGIYKSQKDKILSSQSPAQRHGQAPIAQMVPRSSSKRPARSGSYVIPSLKPSQKRRLSDIPVGTSFTPGLIASKGEHEKQKENKRQRREDKRRLSEYDPVFGSSYNVSANSLERNSTDKFSVPEAPIASGLISNGFVAQVLADRTNGKSTISASDLNEVPPATRPGTEGKTISADDEVRPATRRRTGGKTISAEMLAGLAAAANSNPVSTTVDLSYSAIGADPRPQETPEVLLHYHVYLRYWGSATSRFESNAKTLGPFFIVSEANAVASNEVKYPLEYLSYDEIRDTEFSGAWNYHYEQDEHGMQKHRMEVGGLHAEATVTRSIAPPTPRRSLPASAFTIPRTVYILYTLTTPTPSRSPPHPSSSASTILAAYTTLDLANKAAGKRWLEIVTRDLGNGAEDMIRKTELERDLRRYSRELDETEAEFEWEVLCEDEEGEGAEGVMVWVKGVVVAGGRN